MTPSVRCVRSMGRARRGFRFLCRCERPQLMCAAIFLYSQLFTFEQRGDGLTHGCVRESAGHIEVCVHMHRWTFKSSQQTFTHHQHHPSQQ
mmetsp:Transcript_9054/g.26034  ORF Transcript_9054/g.26034 Transcript_9054/m.26034 type:complete len:91 (-) Transcript_9054:800-1072(-)